MKRSLKSPLVGRTGRDRWLMSYADLVTLLLACFATTYTAAQVSPVPPDRIVPSIALIEPITVHEGTTEPESDITKDLRQLITPIIQLMPSDVDVVDDHRGLVISLPESATFPTGSAVLTDAAKAFLIGLADTVRSTSLLLRIEGHTDDVPVAGGRYATNWELSTARASVVVLFLASSAAMPPQRLAAAGYGEFQPRAANDTVEGRALNRRVDVVITADVRSSGAPSGAAWP